MVYVTLRFEGLPADILEKAVKKGIGKTKSEVLRLSLLKLNEAYDVITREEEEELTSREIHLMEALIEKSIKTNRIVSEKELFASVS